jgi:crotonobetainyl-CoA:carnitine CoA-transferase CaiB-like acyl-CoA transferase
MNALKAIFKTKTRDEWVAELADLDACLGPVYSIEEAFNDPQMQARGVTVTSSTGDYTLRTLPSFPRISDVEREQQYVPPELGEHTSAVLQEFGYNEAEIKRFKAEGAI